MLCSSYVLFILRNNMIVEYGDLSCKIIIVIFIVCMQMVCYTKRTTSLDS